MPDAPEMLTDGIYHVAVLTSDTDRLCAFYQSMFGAAIEHQMDIGDGARLTLLRIGPSSELNVFELPGNTEAERQTPIFGRGRLDHLGLSVPTLEAFDTVRERLMAAGASDGFVTDFGPIYSLFFRDPDGLEAEVNVVNPDAQPGVLHPPGTPAARYSG